METEATPAEPSKDTQAHEIIVECVRRLSELAQSDTIPETWADHFLRLAGVKRGRGRPNDANRVRDEEIAREVLAIRLDDEDRQGILAALRKKDIADVRAAATAPPCSPQTRELARREADSRLRRSLRRRAGGIKPVGVRMDEIANTFGVERRTVESAAKTFENDAVAAEIVKRLNRRDSE